MLFFVFAGQQPLTHDPLLPNGITARLRRMRSEEQAAQIRK